MSEPNQTLPMSYAVDKYGKMREIVDAAARTQSDANAKSVSDLTAKVDDLEETGIEQIVEDYLKENPIDTVTPEEVQGVVNEALQNAKKSGDFVGPPGEPGTPGKDGYTPVKGIDYFTDADKAELENQIVETLISMGVVPVILDANGAILTDATDAIILT